MAAKNKRSPSKQAACKRYKDSMTWSANRLRKLQRHLKAQPNDAQAKKALNNISYRRKKPAHAGINTALRPIGAGFAAIVPVPVKPYAKKS